MSKKNLDGQGRWQSKTIHILFTAPDFQYDTQAYYIMNRARGIEVYVAGATNKYVTVTGQRVNDFEYGNRSAELQTVLDRFMARNPIRTKSESYAGNAINARNSGNPMLSECKILQIARRAKNGATFDKLWNGDWTGYPSHSKADLALCMNLAFWTGKDADLMDKRPHCSDWHWIRRCTRRHQRSVYWGQPCMSCG